MKLNETSAKEFSCYHTEISPPSAADIGATAETPGFPAMYTRTSDLPFKQRRACKREVDGRLPLDATSDCPRLVPFNGIGPYVSWHQVRAALTAHNKCQIYTQRHVQADEGCIVRLAP